LTVKRASSRQRVNHPISLVRFRILADPSVGSIRWKAVLDRANIVRICPDSSLLSGRLAKFDAPLMRGWAMTFARARDNHT
jgi:hypothetical protein